MQVSASVETCISQKACTIKDDQVISDIDNQADNQDMVNLFTE
jgi:hypothetical protein